MDEPAIYQLVADVFGPNYATRTVNGWVSLRCPLAQWKHETGRDSRASAGIKVNNHGTSVFNCYTCKTKVPLQALVRQYGDFTGEDLSELVGELEEEAYLGPRQLQSWDQTREHPDSIPPRALNAELYLDLYDSAAGHPYLAERGISDQTAELLQLKVDPEDPADGEERILFPVFGLNNEFYGFSGRATNPDARLKVRDYEGLEKRKCLLGAHLFGPTGVDPPPSRILVVEGLFDYANVWEQGFAAVAVMHSTLTPMQAAILQDISLPTYLFYDKDKAGQDGVTIAGEQLARYLPLNRVRYPEIWIEDDSPEGGHWVKDPGELLAEDIEGMLDDARLY